MKTKIYIAGKIRRERNRLGLPIDSTLHAGGDYETFMDHENREFEFDTLHYEYTGPYTIGCDHSCAHAYSHAVGPTCGDDFFGHVEGHGMRTEIRKMVSERSLAGIDEADIVFAWLGDDSHEAHGTLVEIGYAKGKGKTILIGCMAYDADETWFAKTMAKKLFIHDDPVEAFRAAMIWINTTDKGQPIE